MLRSYTGLRAARNRHTMLPDQILLWVWKEKGVETATIVLIDCVKSNARGKLRVGRYFPLARWGRYSGLETDPQARTESKTNMVLLLLRRDFAANLECRIAGDPAKSADPAARAIVRNKSEGRAVFERRRR